MMNRRHGIAIYGGFFVADAKIRLPRSVRLDVHFPWIIWGERREEGYRPAQPWFDVNVAQSRRTTGYPKDSQVCPLFNSIQSCGDSPDSLLVSNRVALEGLRGD